MKDKKYSLLQAELFVKKNEWKKLDDELLPNKALINNMNRPKGVLDCYYQKVNTGHYGLGFYLAIDGIYQPDKIEGPKEVIPAVGNVKFVDEKMVHTDEEKEYERRPGKDVIGIDEEFIDGEKFDEEIICERRPGKEIADTDEDYINVLFKNGGPPKNKKKVHTSRSRHQSQTFTSQVKSRSENFFRSNGCEMTNLNGTTFVPHRGKHIDKRYLTDQKKVTQNDRRYQSQNRVNRAQNSVQRQTQNMASR